MNERYTIKILDTPYSVMTDAGRTEVEQVASMVDTAMRELLDKNPRASVTMAAIYAAIQFADGKRRAEERGDKQRREKREADVHGRAVDVGVLHKSSLQQNSYDIFVACGFKGGRYGKGVCFAIRVIP